MDSNALTTQKDAKKHGGQPGNENGHRGAVVREALRKALARRAGGDADKGLAKVCDKVAALAEKGEQWAVQEVFNRLAGRVPQAVEMSGANGGDIVVRDANTSLGIARRIAYVIAMGAIARARQGAMIETKEISHAPDAQG